MELNGAVVVVTGAARGIGFVIAEAFASRGAKVAMADVLADQVAESAAELSSRGMTTLPIRCDVTKVEDVEAMVEQVERALGSIDIQINNAGTFSYIGPLWEAPPEKWTRDIQVNLLGGFLCCRAVAARMAQRERGYILNMVSGGGVGDPHPYSTSYATSKAGLMRLTEGLAAELRPHGVKVFAVAPPAIDTPMTKFIVQDSGGKKWRPEMEALFAEHRDHAPDIVAQWCLNLVGGRADALTGRYFKCLWNFEKVISQSATILERDLLTLRIRSDDSIA